MSRGIPWCQGIKAKVGKLKRAGHRNKAIAKRLGMTTAAVVCICHRQKYYRTNLPERLREAVPRLNALGMSDREIAKRFDCTSETVGVVRNQLGIPVVPGLHSRSNRERWRRIREEEAGGLPRHKNLTLIELRVLKALGRIGADATIAGIARDTGYTYDVVRRGLRGLIGHGIARRDGRRGTERLFRLTPRYQFQVESAMIRHDYPVPPDPCEHPPGSREKIACMRARDDHHFRLWHPGDNPGDVHPDRFHPAFLDLIARLIEQGDPDGDALES